jgi:hypothetical protein
VLCTQNTFYDELFAFVERGTGLPWCFEDGAQVGRLRCVLQPRNCSLCNECGQAKENDDWAVARVCVAVHVLPNKYRKDILHSLSWSCYKNRRRNSMECRTIGGTRRNGRPSTELDGNAGHPVKAYVENEFVFNSACSFQGLSRALPGLED